MDLKQLLTEKKTAILKAWFDAITETYQPDTSAFLKKKKAQFTNPVGFTLSEGMEGLFDGLLAGLLAGDVSRFLDGIVRIRAVQDFPPSEAVAFVFQLKQVVRRELGSDNLARPGIAAELAAFESAVDDLGLFAFDLYMQCREKIYELKANEARNQTYRLLQQARLIVDRPD